MRYLAYKTCFVSLIFLTLLKELKPVNGWGIHTRLAKSWLNQ